jgi:uncharacterized protein HemX
MPGRPQYASTMRGFLGTVVLLVVIAALVVGGQQILHLRSQVKSLQHPRTQSASVSTVTNATRKEKSDVADLNDSLEKLQARVAGDEQADAGATGTSTITSQIDSLDQEVDRICQTLQQRQPGLVCLIL